MVFVAILAMAVGASSAVKKLSQTLAPPFYEFVEKISKATYGGIEQFLDWALKHRVIVLTATLGLFVVSIGVAFLIPSEPAPDIDQSRFTVQIQMPRGTTLEGTSEFVKKLEKDFLSFPGIKAIYSSLGITEEQSFQTVIEASLERAIIEVKVKDNSNSQEVIDKVRGYLATVGPLYAGVEFSVKKRGTTFEQILRPEQDDIKIRIIGRDPIMASRIAGQFAERLHTINGLVDLRTSLQRGNPEYQIVVDRGQASRYGLSVQAVAQHITQQVKGKEATSLSDFDRKITIRVQPTEEQRKSIDDVLLSSIQVGGRNVPLREIVRWQRTDGQAEIWHENQQRAIVFVANVSGRSIGRVVSDIQQQVRQFSLPAGFTISVGGENEEIQESFKSLFIIILLSLFLVYMILAAEYESILYPFVILLTSPLAFIGAIFAMIVAGQHYNVMSLIGIVIMIGAVDNDAVIAVDIITELRRQGIPLVEAVKEGMKLRMRPILMTTATTILGVVPLVFEFGTGSELVRALTIPLVGGLIASTVFTVVAIPIVYTYVDTWALGKAKNG
ncbi:MAG: efflux RND transporter permease subunit [Ignavibacteriales bacterium]|nr:efflux RND transporter permease subunit [Ignavibacteriales bacterium]